MERTDARMGSWYFAYGSNLLKDQVIQRIGSIGLVEHPPRIASLANHRLVFQPLEPGGHAFANIRSPGEGVMGVVYRLSQIDLDKMDHFERGYERQAIQVTDQHGEVLAAIAYVVISSPTASLGKPQEDYLARIITGARQHALPDSYINQVLASANRTP